MVTKAIKKKIDGAIKDVWKNNIKHDYKKDHLLKEDTLKNSFYCHLRKKLGNKYLEDNNIRIYTEFNEHDLKKTKLRADIVIVEIKKDYDGYLGDAVKSIIAIIELKYQPHYASYNVFYKDVEKTKNYIRTFKIESLFYLGFIHEKKHVRNTEWLDGRQTANWANEKVTILSANEWDGDDDAEILDFQVKSYNGLNPEKTDKI